MIRFCFSFKEEAIFSRLIHIPAPQPPPTWLNMCEEAQAKGGSAITAALSEMQHRVPDIDGTTGMNIGDERGWPTLNLNEPRVVERASSHPWRDVN